MNIPFHIRLRAFSTAGIALLLATATAMSSLTATDNAAGAVESINALAADLLPAASNSGGENVLLSPYSIAAAMAMASAGASGETLDEMRRVLHHGGASEEDLHASFKALAAALRESADASRARVKRSAETGGPGEAVSFSIANRLFVEQTRPVLPNFSSFLLANHGASPEPLDFLNAPEPARVRINDWVATETLQRIRDLIPPQGITRDTAVVIANAIHFKAAWEEAFAKTDTCPGPFRLADGSSCEVSMMSGAPRAGYLKEAGRTLVALPYVGRDFLFVISMPEKPGDFAPANDEIAGLLSAAAAPMIEIRLKMPKFKIEPPTLALSGAFKKLGMATAFDIPRGRADFSRISPKLPDDYLFISEVFHKTFLDLDEEGTEAAAATAIAMIHATMLPAEPPPAVTIDQPFHFAIVHRPTGLLLFLGRCGDPR